MVAILKSRDSILSESFEVTDVFSDQTQVTTKQWYALYTRGRHEKLIDRELKKSGVRSYLPLRKISRQWSDRKKTIEEPLFSSYLFVCIDLNERFHVLNKPGAVSLVGKTSGQPTPVSESSLRSVQLFLDHSLAVDPYPYIREGKRIYLKSGPFKGFEGYVVRKDRHCRLVVSIDSMMQSVSVVVDEASVELV